MKYFLDTEFMEDGKTIDLISIALVAEDGRELYLESAEADLSLANDFVKQHVIPNLGPVERRLTRGALRLGIQKFVTCDAPEFVAYFASYDWVALCQLFGAMVDLPKGWPMFCLDLKQLMVSKGGLEPEQLQRQYSTSMDFPHNALQDAKWCKQHWEWAERAPWPAEFRNPPWPQI